MSLLHRPLKPESNEDKQLAQTPNGMRVLLNRYAREHSIPNHVFNFAHHEGLSGEDKYTMLAYHALLQLEHYENIVLDHAASSPSPPVFLMPFDFATDKRDAARYRQLREHFVYAGAEKHCLTWFLPRTFNSGTNLREDFDNSVDMAISSKS